MIFVENEEQLYNLLRKLPTGTFDPRKINFVTDNEMSNIRDGYSAGKSIPINTDMLQELIGERYSGSSGHITFFTKTFGRGVDFKVANSVLTVVNAAGVNVGGAHVIQAFFSPDPKEDLQVQGRAARQTDPGSYEMILLDEKLFKKAAELNKTHAEVIDEEQNSMMQERYEYLDRHIDGAINKSIATITFFQEHMNVSTGGRDKFLRELKGL